MGRESAPCLTSLAIRQFLVTKPNLPDQNPPHYHDLAPSEFCLILIFKKGLKVDHFSPVGEVQQRPIAGPTAVTNRNSRGSSTDRSTAVASVCVCVCLCVCVCVCVCVCAAGQCLVRLA
jgi:hypothetical protein